MAVQLLDNGTLSFYGLKLAVDRANDKVQTASILSGIKQFLTTGTIFVIAGQVKNVTDLVHKSLESVEQLPTDYKPDDTIQNNLPFTYNEYLLSVSGFAGTVGIKGTNFHVEYNKPVADALADLSTAVLALGSEVLTAGLVSPILGKNTTDAGDAVLRARTTWLKPFNFRGTLAASEGGANGLNGRQV